MPKTGSTLLQDHLFRNHPDIDFVGKYWRGRKYADQHFEAMTSHVFQPIKEMRRLDDEHKRAIQCRAVRARDAGKVMLWSKEGTLSGSRHSDHARAARFREALGDCKVFFVIRHPLDWVESEYWQSVKGLHLRPKVRRTWAPDSLRMPVMFSIDQWLEWNWQLKTTGLLSSLRYDETLREYARVFGDENVEIFMFEELKESLTAFVRKLSSYLGIDAKAAIEVTAGQRANDRWTTAQIKLLESIQRSAWRRWAFRRASHAKRMSMLGLDVVTDEPLKNNAPKVRARLSAMWIERITQITRERNRWLVEQRGLPLAKYGYPL
tara:strand:- start:153 stop:1115 length:963 start_codon:yes stop_codon:yes gene_type:complete